MSDRIVSMPANDAYRAGWERAFGKLRCGHPVSALYVGKYAIPEGECVECGHEYVERLQAEAELLRQELERQESKESHQ